MAHRAPVLQSRPVVSGVAFRVTALRAREVVLALAEGQGQPAEPTTADSATAPQPPSRHRRHGHRHRRPSRRRPSTDAGAIR